MESVWYEFDHWADLSQELDLYLDDPANPIHEEHANTLSEMGLNHHYVIANAVGLALAVFCLLVSAIGKRGLAFGVFTIKALLLVFSSGLQLGLLFFRRASAGPSALAEMLTE